MENKLDYVKESAIGLFWALVVLVTLFAHYGLCNDVPEFRYIGY